MQKSLYDKTKEYAKSHPIRFHMPSHNGEDLGITTDMDITELSFSDNLIDSNGIIRETEKNIAKAYKTNYATMLTGGATLGVAMSLRTAGNFGNKLLMVGDLHKSVHNFANLFGFDISYADNLNEVADDDFDAIILTSPDYFGMVKDIQNLKNSKAIVIVDASHAAHFAFCDKLPNLPTNIADIVILSFHKTLPVMTGGAAVVCNDKDIYNMLCFARSELHSSSPSYLTMASIDKAIVDFSQNGNNLYEICLKQIDDFKYCLDKRYRVIDTDDKTRLCICANGFDGDAIAKELENKNIFVEMTYKDILVAIVTPFNCKHLATLAKELNCLHPNVKICDILTKKPSKIGSKMGKIDFLPLKECLDRTCAGCIGIYPPGTPIVKNGEIFDTQMIDFLSTTKCEIFGLINGLVPVYKN